MDLVRKKLNPYFDCDGKIKKYSIDYSILHEAYFHLIMMIDKSIFEKLDFNTKKYDKDL